MKQRILVLGARNFLGRRVLAALQNSGWAEPIAEHPAREWRESLVGLHGIVNAASGSAKMIRSQARAAAGAALAAGPEARLVHVSSMTVYGSLDRRVDETSELLSDLGEYASAQIDAERIVGSHANTVVLRPGCEYGPGCPQWSERIAHLLLARRLGDLGAAGDGWCNLTYIDDLVGGILKCLRQADLAGETFNLGVRSPPTWNEYLVRFGIALRAVPVRRITSRRLKLETQILSLPLKMLEMAAHRLPRTGRFNMPALTPSLLRLCGQRIVLDVAKAQDVLGMLFTPLDEGLGKAAAPLRRESAIRR
ncbi:MAG: NAD-dependent epimerase/dehydratase family protein [Gammaproteobacteria bacterium]